MKYKDTDVDEWPASWAVFPEDVRYGKQILPYMKEFIDDWDSCRSRRVARRS